jgi:transposase-like protein
MDLVDAKAEVKYQNVGVRMERIPKAVYTRELREEAVKLVAEGGLTVREVGERVSIPHQTIKYWLKMDRKGKLSDVGKQQKPMTEVEAELLRVKRELAEVKMGPSDMLIGPNEPS